MKTLSDMKIKSIVLSVIVALIITMMPMSSFAAKKKFKAPKCTKIISAKLTDSREVTLKWKKVKGVTGYKIYRKKENTSLKYIGKVKGASKRTYVDTDLDKYDYGEIRYCVRTYKTKKGKTKTSSKRYTNRKSVRIKDMAWDPYTEPVNEEIYNAYKRASSRDISLYAIRELMLYAVNKERAEYWGDDEHALQQLDILNETAQEKCEEMNRIKEYAHVLSTIGSMGDQLDIARGFKNYLGSGENICCDFSAAGAMSAWMASAGHRANIIKKDFTHIGIGFCNGYCTQQFIQYSNEEVNHCDCSKYFK